VEIAMRVLSSFAFITALTSLSLGAGCKSEDAKAQQVPGAAATGQAPGATSPDERGEQPSLPVPRRMRGSDATGEPVDDARRQQMMERRAEMKKRFDKDGDGELNDEERTAMHRERINRRVQRVDTDGDGKISKTEAEAHPIGGRMLSDFAAADADQDSFISPEELEAAMAERRQQMRERRREMRRSGGPSAPESMDEPADDEQ
jgi:Ca2+-binding EF-hand superfamily protein